MSISPGFDTPWLFYMIFFKKYISFSSFFIILILVSVYYLYASTSHEKAITESILLLLISTLSTILLIYYKGPSQITNFELICITFIIYLLFENLFFYDFDISGLSYLLFLIISYFGLKSFFLKNKNPVSFILIFIIAIILLSYIFFTFYFLQHRKEGMINLYLLNKSIFSILLASQIALLIPLILNLKSNKHLYRFGKEIVLIIVILSVVLLYFTNGRSGWLGFSLAIVYIFYCSSKKSQFKKIFSYFILPTVILLLALLFWYKPDSSNGRLLIYKVSMSMLKDNWLFGIGSGQFKIQYNQSQAAYFAKHNIDSKEAMLADNTFYAFNDFFQLIIENGIIGLLFLIVIIYLFIYQVKKTIINDDNKHVFIAAIASLICIVTGSLVSYPMQIFPIVFQLVVCLAIINTYSSAGEIKIKLLQKLKKIPVIIIALLGCYLSVYFYFNFQFSRKNLQAFQLERMGFSQKALKLYKGLNGSIIKDGDMLYSYARALYYSNQPILAAQILKVAKKYYCSNAVYKLSAQIEQELENYPQAEKDYQTAVYIVPNRMISRYDLLNYYIEQKDTGNVIYWSNSIVHMPVKIPSQFATNLQIKAKEILSQYNKMNSLNSIK